MIKHPKNMTFESSKRSWFGIGVLLTCLLSNVGCQCLGPTSTCLRSEGPILSMTRRLRDAHLERSHYTRVIPDSYIEQAAPAQSPSRFHPVPSRNVFSQPAANGPAMMPMLVGPSESYETYPGHQVTPNMDSMILERAPDGLAPPIYQPENVDSGESSVLTPGLDLNSSPDDSNSPETLPAPLDSELDNMVPPELERPETQDDKVTHRDLIQYPYTLDTERPYSDWVRGIDPSRPKESQAAAGPVSTGHGPVNQASTVQQLELGQNSLDITRLRSNSAWRNEALPLPTRAHTGQPTRPVGFESPEFAPPVYVAPFVDGQSAKRIPNLPTRPQTAPQKILRRQTSFGPTQSPSVVPQARQSTTQPVVQNGVPYVPSNDTSHPMFQSNLPFVQLEQNGQRKEEVYLHSALQDRYRGTTIR